jgi:hypothetical protein
MNEEINSLKFIQKLQECIKEYKKQLNSTRDDSDAAAFYNAGLKKFLKDHRAEMNILAQMNFDKSFMNWMKSYLLSEKKED